MMQNEAYTLRARVIEGTIPLPKGHEFKYRNLTAGDFEIFAPYTRENLNRLFEIGKEAFEKGTLSKFEILGWAGGCNNHDGPRFLWYFRPDKTGFKEIEPWLNRCFDSWDPVEFLPAAQTYYDMNWKNLKFGFSLSSYEALAFGKEQLSLREYMDQARDKAITQNNTAFKDKNTMDRCF